MTTGPDFEDQTSLIDMIDQGVEIFIKTISERLVLQNLIGLQEEFNGKV